MQAEIHTKKQAHAYIHTETHTCRLANRDSQIQTTIHTDRHTYGEIDIPTDRDAYIHTDWQAHIQEDRH